ncbi:hypothetical protein E4T56_gene13406, partial [Termitomyces sp. T112]
MPSTATHKAEDQPGRHQRMIGMGDDIDRHARGIARHEGDEIAAVGDKTAGIDKARQRGKRNGKAASGAVEPVHSVCRSLRGRFDRHHRPGDFLQHPGHGIGHHLIRRGNIGNR